jgi:hypothetical protein
MGKSYTQDNVGIYGYGSLLKDAGANIESRIIGRIPFSSPWPIEYVRLSNLWGGGPTLALHQTGGKVEGQILVLSVQSDALSHVREWLREREGNPPLAWIKEMELGGFNRVLYCDLEPTLSEADIKPDSLARFAIESVRIKPDKNGIRYLRQNIERNLITPFTYAYRDQILRQSGAKDLLEAEKVLLERK